MLRPILAIAGLALASVVACGGGSSSNGGGPGGGPDGGGPPPSDGGPTGTPDSAVPPPPPQTCALPSMPVDVSKPTTVVGTGTAASCTEQALDAAVAAGGIVTFNCGPVPATITVTSEVPVAMDTTIDGGGKVTLSGGKTTRILHIKSAWNVATPLLTVQNLTFQDGFTTDTVNTTSTKQGGAAIFEDGGSLTVINCTFHNNQCASTGQDVSGGAINGQGVGTLIIEGSVFSGNSGSNGGAVGTQDENVTVVNTTFDSNSATGNMGNPGNGGDGGALSYDGAMVSLTFCGDKFTQNHANAAGGAVFRVGYHDEPVTIDRSTFDGNTVDMTMGNAGGLYLEYVTITATDTTISNNFANYGAGIWVGHNAIGNFTNVTIANNHANMGGGVWFAGGTSGTFLNVTIAGNDGDGLFGDSVVKLENTLIVNNTAGPSCSANNCTGTYGDGGPCMQFPDGSGKHCTSSVMIADPMLGPLMDNAGPSQTMLPAAGSPAVGKGTGCPPTDENGKMRPAACTLGAAEP